MRQRFLIGETVMVHLDDGRRRPIQLAEIVGASDETWTVRLRDQSLVEVVEGCVLERVIVVRYPCPCCGFLTILHVGAGPPGTWAICPLCWWEDDLLQSRDPRLPRGANKMSLFEARADFEEWRRAGMPTDPHRRPPLPEELPRPRPNA